jgi:glycosyltransferase involved in cell wall biosynthesis
MHEVSSIPTVAVLLPTFNGENFLEEQLESLLNQEGVLTKVYIRDDASTDKTVQILEKYTKVFEIVFSEVNIGTTASLLSLLHRAKDYDFVAFCDQDDVWASNHLVLAVQDLMNTNKVIGAFYFPQYNYIDTQSKLIRKRMPVSNIGCSNALVENPIIGCGLVFNEFAAGKIKELDLSTNYFLDHQIYFLGSLIGEIHQGASYSINYRIHPGNQVGISAGALNLFASFSRAIDKLNQIKRQQLALKKIYFQIAKLIPQDSTYVPSRHFSAVYSRNVIIKLKYFFHPQFRRQKRLDQILFRLVFVLLF